MTTSRKKPVRVTPDLLAVMHEFFEDDDFSTHEIALALDMHYQTVWKRRQQWISERGVARKHPCYLPVDVVNKMYEMFADGISLKMVAETLKVNYSTVCVRHHRWRPRNTKHKILDKNPHLAPSLLREKLATARNRPRRKHK